MRRCALVFALVLGTAFTPQHLQIHHYPCEINWYKGRAAVDRLISCEAIHWRTPGGPAFAQQVADCESSDNPSESTGRFHGIYQIGWSAEWLHWPKPHGWQIWTWAGGLGPRYYWTRYSGEFQGRANIVRALAYVHWRATHGFDPWGPWACSHGSY